MKSSRSFPQVSITEKGERHLKTGHPWLYAGEVVSINGCVDGELCDVVSPKGRYIGTGFYNSASLLRVRLISTNANDLFDAAFWERRLRYALDYRHAVMGEDFSACRLIFGEADHFPGLTVDLFNDLLSVEVQSLGIDRLRGLLFPLLRKLLKEDGIQVRGLFERSEGGLRAKEGMEERTGFFPFEGEEVLTEAETCITENGIRYHVNVSTGQKTGFFLDQKYNRRAVGALSEGRRVLDCFTHTGSFGLNCARGGAKSVHCVDVSEEALSMAQKNAALNGLEGRMTFERANAMEWLPAQAEAKAKYDLVILDPPAFTKSRKTAYNAEKGYRDINRAGLMLTARGGFFATASCSHFMPSEGFERAVMGAAREVGMELRLVERRGQAPDHPVLMSVPETEYLKFYIFQVV